MTLSVDIAARRGGFALEARFEAPAGLTALLGPSGAGKTSLLRCVAGLIRPERGRILLDGTTLLDAAAGLHLPPHARRVGYVFQEPRLFPHLDVRRNLLYGRRWRPGEGPTLDRVAALLDLDPLLGRPPAALSGGEARRVAIGRALLSGPRLLLLDEPLAGLNPELRARTLALLGRVRREMGVPAVHVSHRVEEIAGDAAAFVLVEEGRVLAAGRWDAILGDSAAFAAARRMGLPNILDVEVEGRRPEEGVLAARLAGQPVRLPPWDATPGDRLRAGLRPEDLVLGDPAVDPGPLSLQNRLRARVAACADLPGGAVLVRLDAGQPVVAEVTRRARDALRLAPGREVACLFKATALVRLP